jgi:hypothetical protein
VRSARQIDHEQRCCGLILNTNLKICRLFNNETVLKEVTAFLLGTIGETQESMGKRSEFVLDPRGR